MKASGVGADDGGEAMAGWVVEAQTKLTKKVMDKRVRARVKEIEKGSTKH